MSARGNDSGLNDRIQQLEDRVRLLEQGVGLTSLTLRRLRLTDRVGTGKIEIVAVEGGLEFRDLILNNGVLFMPVPGGFDTTDEEVDEIVFSLAGSLATATSPPWKSLRTRTVTTITTSLGTAGSTSSTIVVRKNGTVWQTITIPAAAILVQTVVDTDIIDADILTVSVTTAGTSAANLTVQIGFTF